MQPNTNKLSWTSKTQEERFLGGTQAVAEKQNGQGGIIKEQQLAVCTTSLSLSLLRNTQVTAGIAAFKSNRKIA